MSLCALLCNAQMDWQVDIVAVLLFFIVFLFVVAVILVTINSIVTQLEQNVEQAAINLFQKGKKNFNFETLDANCLSLLV